MDISIMKSRLSEIDHYKSYPAMIPFIGDYYLSQNHKKMLLIGESYYLPNETVLHHSANRWYLSTQKELNEEETEWINCDGLLRCKWESAGHFIYREINSSIFSLPFDKKQRAIDEIAFTNYFQRPAEKEGESFKGFCVQEDIERSKKIVNKVIEDLDPELIIFVSKYAWDIGGKEIKLKYKDKIVDFVCHPGTGGRYWHNKNYIHGKNKFLKLLKGKFI